ncbi:hypothetical protein J6590_084429, partial [Homalodisca vitripennis]
KPKLSSLLIRPTPPSPPSTSPSLLLEIGSFKKSHTSLEEKFSSLEASIKNLLRIRNGKEETSERKIPRHKHKTNPKAKYSASLKVQKTKASISQAEHPTSKPIPEIAQPIHSNSNKEHPSFTSTANFTKKLSPPITAIIRPSSQTTEDFFNEHIEFFKRNMQISSTTHQITLKASNQCSTAFLGQAPNQQHTFLEKTKTKIVKP